MSLKVNSLQGMMYNPIFVWNNFVFVTYNPMQNFGFLDNLCQEEQVREEDRKKERTDKNQE